LSTGAGSNELLEVDDHGVDAVVLAPGESAIAARSPLQLFWRRLRKDKVAMVSAYFIVALILMAIFAPLIVTLANAADPKQQNFDALDLFGVPADLRMAAEEAAVESMKRVARAPRDAERFDWLDDARAQRPEWIARFMEMKTVWHPIGV